MIVGRYDLHIMWVWLILNIVDSYLTCAPGQVHLMSLAITLLQTHKLAILY